MLKIFEHNSLHELLLRHLILKSVKFKKGWNFFVLVPFNKSIQTLLNKNTIFELSFDTNSHKLQVLFPSPALGNETTPLLHEILKLHNALITFLSTCEELSEIFFFQL
jgi:hypothetical protein